MNEIEKIEDGIIYMAHGVISIRNIVYISNVYTAKSFNLFILIKGKFYFGKIIQYYKFRFTTASGGLYYQRYMTHEEAVKDLFMILEYMKMK